jgi:hypothetical protein
MHDLSLDPFSCLSCTPNRTMRKMASIIFASAHSYLITLRSAFHARFFNARFSILLHLRAHEHCFSCNVLHCSIANDCLPAHEPSLVISVPHACILLDTLFAIPSAQIVTFTLHFSITVCSQSVWLPRGARSEQQRF